MKTKHLVSFVLVLTLLSLVSCSKSKKSVPEVKEAEYIISGKVTQNAVKSRLTPIALYRIDGDNAYFAGSGSVFTGSNGEQVITSEHIFHKELGVARFGFRKLRPLEPNITHGIEKVLHRGIELSPAPGLSPDVIILKTGEVKPIECFSVHNLELKSVTSEISKYVDPIIVRSLVTGEQVRIIGINKFSDTGVGYVILEYPSFSGESGTGFVDEKDDLYVLKGVMELDAELRDKVSKVLGTKSELSIAFGPLSPRS